MTQCVVARPGVIAPLMGEALHSKGAEQIPSPRPLQRNGTEHVPFFVMQNMTGFERAEKAMTQCVVARPGVIAPLMGEALQSKGAEQIPSPRPLQRNGTSLRTVFVCDRIRTRRIFSIFRVGFN